MDTMTGMKRTHYAVEVREVDDIVCVAGFVQKVRNLGNLIFVDLRDRTGIVQLAFNDSTVREVFEKAGSLRTEFVIAAKGITRKRENINPDLPTGHIEIYVDELRIFSKSLTPPFEIVENSNVKEELRLKYRYLDLRRSDMQKNFIIRHRMAKIARDYFDENGFLEIETPILMRATPEGARDYLVPSRVHEGKFFALPQSPQLFKQLLMLSGFDKYIQFARCFRDEDLRADRQPEFTQIDLEMSFVDEEDVMTINEGFMKVLFSEILNTDIATPFKRLTYKDAMENYGSDKPDTRFDMKLIDISDLLKSCEFKVFSSVIETGSVRVINVKNSVSVLTRKEIDKLTLFAKTYRAKGLAFSRYSDDGITSSFEKFLSPDEVKAIHEKTNFQKGDVLLVVADSINDVVFDSLGALRVHIAQKLGYIQKGTYDLLWVTDFPLFEYDIEEKRYFAKHHPFTAPKDVSMMENDPEHATAIAYDLVLNGCEIGGGSIRINDQEIQQKMFKALGMSEETARERFDFLLEAFQYGVPPHGGMAYGFDRLVMLFLGKDSLRDVIAFPKVQNSSDLMNFCPSPVEQKNLDELHISINPASN